MGNRRKINRIFSADFETTVYDGQTSTEVWAAATVELGTEDVHIFHSIGDLFAYYESMNEHVRVYFHNLKFDGSFCIDYLLKNGYCLDGVPIGTNAYEYSEKDTDMADGTFKPIITEMGQWFMITIKMSNGFILELRDSLKLLPFSVDKIGKDFQLKHKKLNMEYKGRRYAGCEITQEEQKYIANDVLVVKEALEYMFSEGHDKLTIGSCCMAEFKNIWNTGKFSSLDYDSMFPDLYKSNRLMEQAKEDPHSYGTANVGEYIRKSYHGGWCYVRPGKAGIMYVTEKFKEGKKVFKESKKVFNRRLNRKAANQLSGNQTRTRIIKGRGGVTCDVNSLYPSMMHSMSGNHYPVGLPIFWCGNYIPEEATKFGKKRYYFVRVRTRFYLKPGYLPFIQIKHSHLYRGTEMLETSDYIDEHGVAHRYVKDAEGNTIPTTVTMTMTCTDYELFREHYDVEDFEILDGCWFFTLIGLFDEYIDKYAKIKKTSKGAKRQLAKLFLNNLYGKFATSPDSYMKIPYLGEDNIVHYERRSCGDKTPGYIPIGAAITSYARNFTIRAAQKNFHGDDKPGFIYADTDSIHCDLAPDEVQGVTIHPVNFCCWAMESRWDKAIFVRQKTYIEHVVETDLSKQEDGTWKGDEVTPTYDVKCAGMPKNCKMLFAMRLDHPENVSRETYENGNVSRETLEFLFQDDGSLNPAELSDFAPGLTIPGKLMPRVIEGGTLLMETTFKIKEVK